MCVYIYIYFFLQKRHLWLSEILLLITHESIEQMVKIYMKAKVIDLFFLGIQFLLPNYWSPPKGDQSGVFIGATDAEAETPVLWLPHAKSWLIWKDPDAGRDWGQEEKGATEDEMVGWHHWLNGHGFGWTPGVGDGQGGLACCSSWGRRVRHNWVTELDWSSNHCVLCWEGQTKGGKIQADSNPRGASLKEGKYSTFKTDSE